MITKTQIADWLIPVAIAVVATVSLLIGDDAMLALSYERASIASGEYLRLIAGHVVHLGVAHYVMNLAGLALVWYLVGSAYSPSQWLAVFLSCIVTMDLGFWFLMPELDWYVGLSGLLHGMLAAGIAGIWRNHRLEATIILGFLFLKLGYEGLIGPLPGSGDMTGSQVITEAHLFGAVGGAIAGMLISIRVRPEAPI